MSHVQAELAKRGVTESNSQAENPLDLVRRLLGKPTGTRDKREENMRKIQEALEKLPPRRKNEP
jgi:hypothetical protein